MTEVMDFCANLSRLARSRSAGVAAEGGLSAYAKRRAAKRKGPPETRVLSRMENQPGAAQAKRMHEKNRRGTNHEI
jgi:hypothetical protein